MKGDVSFQNQVHASKIQFSSDIRQTNDVSKISSNEILWNWQQYHSLMNNEGCVTLIVVDFETHKMFGMKTMYATIKREWGCFYKHYWNSFCPKKYIYMQRNASLLHQLILKVFLFS